MKYLAEIAVFTVLLSCCGHALNRNRVRERLILHRISLSAGRFDPFYSEANARRSKRQTFPSDDEDVEGSGTSSQDTDVTVSTTQSNLLPEQPPTVPTDWVWYRTSINFLNSINFNEDLADYNTDAFAELSNEIMVDVEEYLKRELEGYFEATPLMFQQQENGDIIVLIDVGFCVSQSISDVTNALTSLVSGGQIGRFRVSGDGFSVRRIGVDSERSECVPGPVLPTSNVPPPSESAPPFVETTTEPPPFDVGTSSTSTTSRSTQPPPCRPDQATCSNRRCIDRSYVCDGANDCLDFSDEPESCGIVADRCDPTEFLCLGTGICAQKIWRCDGDDDCGNGYDESNCPTASPDARCASIQFECRNRVCIPSSYHCDGQPDCEDGSDEEGCSPPVVITPPKHLVSAVEGETVTLDCEAVGVPNPIISWRVNWGNVPPAPRVTMTSTDGKGTLTIRKIKLSDQGAYTCEAINPNGSILGTPDAIVSVTERPERNPEPTFPSEPGGPIGADKGFCPPGEYDTSPNSPDGCKPCWCSNRSEECVSSKLEFSEVEIEFTEPDNKQDVTLEPTDVDGNPEGFQPVTESQIDVNPPARELQLIDLSKRFLAAAHYWSLPAQFLGAKINSYGGTLTFSFSYNNSYHLPNVPTNHTDVILEGNGKTLHYKSKGPHPEPTVKHMTQVLLEEDQFKTPEGDAVSREDMLNVLGRLDRVLVRTVYDKSMLSTGIGDVKLLVAEPTTSDRGDGGGTQKAGVITHAVEECTCPPGYGGLSCEISCELGSVAGKCRSSLPTWGELHDAPALTFMCDDGYTGWDCKQCAEEYVLHKGECVPHLDMRCNVGVDEERRLGKDCKCKLGLEGSRCDRCKPGYYFLSENNNDGCLKCYCMGVSNACTSTTWHMTRIALLPKDIPNFTLTNEVMNETFPNNVRVEGALDGGKPVQNYDFDVNSTSEFRKQYQLHFTVQITELPHYDVDLYYWVLPEKFLGNKLTSYGGKLGYTVHYNVGHNSGPIYTIPRVKLIGNGMTLIYMHQDYPALDGVTKFIIELTENNWLTASETAASREEIMLVLSKLDAILIRASHSTKMEATTISNIYMDTAVPRHTGKPAAYKVEQCSCPVGYTGLSCEDCAAGYTKFDSRDRPAACRPCECNSHSDSCDRATGVCLDCRHNTKGKRCEKCASGYFGVATRGTSSDCRECACPDTGTNSFSETCRYDVLTNRLTCTACREGYVGQRCENCAPGYEGNPTVVGGLCRKRASPFPTQRLPEVIVSQKNVDARKRSSITIRCVVNSSSPVAAMWHRGGSNYGPLPQGTVVTNRGRTLRFPSFSSSQVGTYQCTARNRFGSRSDSVSISLARERPMIRVRVEKPNRIEVDVGSSVTFKCSARSKMPAFVVSWTKPKDRLPLSRATDFEGVLHITNVQLSDSGTYVCTGSNMYGTDQKVATLVVV